MHGLRRKSALVTGASRGIGRGIALRLAQDGAIVAVNYASDKSAADETVALIEKAGGRAFTVQAELGTASAVENLLDATQAGFVEHAGSSKLDILVNNAGMKGFDLLDALTEETVDSYFTVNAKAPFFLIMKALPLMPDGGRIINISSSSTRMASPPSIAYSMSKGALEQIAQHLAPVLAPRNITINTVSPGVTVTEHPFYQDPQFRKWAAGLSIFNRLGTVSEVADIVAFVASEDARWMTGGNIDASGGALTALASPQMAEPVDRELSGGSDDLQKLSRVEDADILEAAGLEVVNQPTA
ncbi:SDR family oxidoreductase [Streptomyces sp. NPDC007084]|uniref:SDR family oxidoreductase n=1 Tax=Streptomyces sp. NPDC007084 TaxID=3154313 RepID=UPI0034513088